MILIKGQWTEYRVASWSQESVTYLWPCYSVEYKKKTFEVSVGGRVTDLLNLRDQKAHFAITTEKIGKIQTHIFFHSWYIHLITHLTM